MSGSNLRRRRRDAYVWRDKPRDELLAGREALRRGEGLFRCLLPRVPETSEAHLATVTPCGTPCFLHRRAEHLVAVHGMLGGSRATEAQLAEFFAAAEPVEDLLDFDAPKPRRRRRRLIKQGDPR